MTTIPHKLTRGFTLIEILVAVLILSIGLLGLASLQANGLRNNYGAYARSQAAILANDMADRIRANATGASAGFYNNISASPGFDPGCLTGNCSPEQISQHDTFNWYANLQQLLPAGTGTVTGNGTQFTITVRWDERDGATGTGCNPAVATDLPCFITIIVP